GIRSASPSPFTSPTVRNPPFRRVGSKAKKSLKTCWGLPATTDFPSYPATRGPPWNPAATIRSPYPFPATSPTAARAPPRKVGASVPEEAAIRPDLAPSHHVTRGPPPSSGVTTTSARPLPVRSPAATYRPPVNDDSNGWVRNSSFRDAPSNTATRPGPPGPVAAMMSSVPSPFTSAEAPRLPPGHPGHGVRVNAALPGVV